MNAQLEQLEATSEEAWKAHINNRLAPLVSVTNHPSPSTAILATAHRATLAELDEALKAANLIRSSLNNLIPICRLPAEVLSQIFAHLSEVYRPDCDYYHRMASLGWVCVLHVCRRWREVARGCGELWTSIELDLGSKWLTLFLELSHSRPLTLRRMPRKSHQHAPDWKTKSFAIQALKSGPLLERLETLEIIEQEFFPVGAQYTDFLEALASLPPGALPRLRTLRLNPPYRVTAAHTFPVHILASVTNLTLTANMIGGQDIWPRLPNAFRSLHFLVGPKHKRGISQHDLQGFIPFISRCDQLSTLEIHSNFLNVIPVDEDEDIRLPAIRSLSLRGKTSIVLSLLRRLSAPAYLKKLSINTFVAEGSMLLNPVADIISSMPCAQAQYQTLFLGHYAIKDSQRSRDKGYVALQARMSDTHAIDGEHLGPEDMVLDLRLRHGKHSENDFAQRSALADELLRIVNSASVKTLIVRGLHAPPGIWKRWFGGMRTISCLILQRSEVLALLRALGLPATEALILNNRDDALFPELKTLSISYANFSKMIAPALERGHAAAVLKETLTSRMMVGCTTKHLLLRECKVEEQELRTWVDAVPVHLRDWTLESLQEGAVRSR
ncbi:unnamed protein product [Peniophora sp. CBMAI 1063]|nr:unnamed protein product [Peniophora sp. CBMAI 1063]